MYSPEAISRDISSNLMFSSSSSNNGFKHGFVDGGFFKSKEILGSSSDLFQNQNQQQQNSRLMRYRSAPSSYFANYLDGNNTTTTTTNNSSNNNSNNGDSSESDSIFSALMNNCNEPSNDMSQRRHHHHQQQHDQRNHQGLHVSPGLMKLEMNEVQSNPQFHENGNGFSAADNMVQMGGYQAAVSAGGGTVVGSYTVPVGVENQQQMRINSNGNRSNLVRQSSSPAGFFSGFNAMRGGEVRKFSNNGETCSSSNSGLNNHQLNFASTPSSSSRYMPSIAEHGNETVEASSPDNVQLVGNRDETSMAAYTSAAFSTEPWNEPPPPAPVPAFSILKRNRDGDFKMFSDFNRLENQDGGETRTHSHTLTHHLSLPKTAGEMAVIEKYLQFQQDSVPCKIRAKRGCATHPRSIAERMRRTRISERMKKLQELFPNMDKQTNTADMLDLAVEYIKDLQKQVQTLTETRAKCKCSSTKTNTIS